MTVKWSPTLPLPAQSGVPPQTLTFFPSFSHPVVRIQPRNWQGSSVHTATTDSVIFTLPATTSLCPMEDSQEPVDIRVTQQCLLEDSLPSVSSAGPCICPLMMLVAPSVTMGFSISPEPQPGALVGLRPHSSGHPNLFYFQRVESFLQQPGLRELRVKLSRLLSTTKILKSRAPFIPDEGTSESPECQ